MSAWCVLALGFGLAAEVCAEPQRPFVVHGELAPFTGYPDNAGLALGVQGGAVAARIGVSTAGFFGFGLTSRFAELGYLPPVGHLRWGDFRADVGLFGQVRYNRRAFEGLEHSPPPRLYWSFALVVEATAVYWTTDHAGLLLVPYLGPMIVPTKFGLVEDWSRGLVQWTAGAWAGLAFK
jgi:hypothetical protein